MKMAGLTRRMTLKTTAAVVPRITRVVPRCDMERLGSHYGGWWIPTGLLSRDAVVYAAGVGEDVTFDLALIERFGCEVWAMDPTPRSIAFAARIAEPRWNFLPIGLWKENATVHFHPPADPAHVSHSVTEIRGSGHGFDAQCRQLTTLMTEMGHDRLDLLKMDIEGAEGPVLDQMLARGVRPRILCVEFDTPESPRALLRRLRRLEDAGYVIRQTEGRNYTLTQG
ncbi:FkbM family methyltransferase [Streptomyces sp. NBC_01262]|uniref:FkbM family methyltransferase n=1 Tax=Streptomyces sp. NBC_01262 TaxID=2903803 RepID=UPI002E3029CA|nr:FkbM family methyltransferase [Streptomyces sp. NBC_01262]